MGDSRRFELFAKLIHRNFPPSIYHRVADIAGGKGKLQRCLRSKGYHAITTFDRRHRNQNLAVDITYRGRYFSNAVKDQFDLLIGMHPDEATDVIIIEAVKRRIPFIVCPCCIKPSAVPFTARPIFSCWIKHLRRIAVERGYKVWETCLPITGKNICLIGRP